MKLVRGFVLLASIVLLSSPSYSAENPMEESYYYDEVFKCGLYVSGEWGAINADEFYIEIAPDWAVEKYENEMGELTLDEQANKGISQGQALELATIKINEIWYSEIILMKGMRACWVQELPNNDYALLFLRFAPVMNIVEEGETLEPLCLEDVKAGNTSWAYDHHIEMTSKQSQLGGEDCYAFECFGMGCGFAIWRDGIIATKSYSYSLPKSYNGKDYVLSLEMCSPLQYYNDLLPSFKAAVESFRFGPQEARIVYVKHEVSQEIVPATEAPKPLDERELLPDLVASIPPQEDIFSGTIFSIDWTDKRSELHLGSGKIDDFKETFNRLISEGDVIDHIEILFHIDSRESTPEFEDIQLGLSGLGVEVNPKFQIGQIDFDHPESFQHVCDLLDNYDFPRHFRIVSAKILIAPAERDEEDPSNLLKPEAEVDADKVESEE